MFGADVSVNSLICFFFGGGGGGESVESAPKFVESRRLACEMLFLEQG